MMKWRSSRKRTHCTVQIQYCLFLKVVVCWEHRQPFVPTSPVMTSTPETLRKPPVKSPNIRGRSQGRLSVYTAHFHHFLRGDTESLATTYQINHRWLIKQPWLMAELQTIHLLFHHIGNEHTRAPATISELKSPIALQGTVTSNHQLHCL